MIAKITNFKKHIQSLIPMSDASFNHCLNFLETKTIKKNEYFMKQNLKCNKIAFINKGLFRIYYLKNGIEINTCFCLENSIISSFNSFINNTVSNENIQAIEDTTVVILTKNKLYKLFALSNQWQLLSKILTEKECLRLSNRVNELSFKTTAKKYQHLLKYQPEIIQRVPVQFIASYLGVSRETLSRIRAKII